MKLFNFKTILFVILLFNTLVTLVQGAYYAPGSVEYNERLADIKEEHAYAVLNEQYFSGMFREAMARYKKPGFFFMDSSFGGGPHATLAVMAEIPFWGDEDEYQIGAHFAGLTYGVPDANKDFNAGFNMALGMDFYLYEYNTILFAGLNIPTSGGPLSEEQMEDYATGRQELYEVTNYVVPYFYIDNPWTKKFRTRVDFNLGSSFNEFLRLGFALFFSLQGFQVSSSYDSIKVYGGSQYDMGIEARLGEKSEQAGPRSLFTPHIYVKYGTLFDVLEGESFSEESSAGKAQYIKAEIVTPSEEYGCLLIGGISFKGGEGLGLRGGFAAGGKDGFLLGSFQYNYIMTDIYGTNIYQWSIVFSMSMKWD